MTWGCRKCMIIWVAVALVGVVGVVMLSLHVFMGGKGGSQ